MPAYFKRAEEVRKTPGKHCCLPGVLGSYEILFEKAENPVEQVETAEYRNGNEGNGGHDLNQDVQGRANGIF